MKELQGRASDVSAASFEACLALLKAVDRYPDWYPEVVRQVEVVDRDPEGQPTRARTKLHLSRGPIVKDFDLILAIVVEPPGTVKLTRTSDRPSQQRFDVSWQLREAAGTRIELLLDASLDAPRFLPLGGIGDSIAGEFVAAATRALATQRP